MPDGAGADRVVDLGNDLLLVEVQLGAVGGASGAQVQGAGGGVELDGLDLPGELGRDGWPLIGVAQPRSATIRARASAKGNGSRPPLRRVGAAVIRVRLG